jgi:hypothetical protein
MIMRCGLRAGIAGLLLAGMAAAPEAPKTKGSRTPIDTNGMIAAEFSEIVGKVRAMDVLRSHYRGWDTLAKRYLQPMAWREQGLSRASGTLRVARISGR